MTAPPLRDRIVLLAASLEDYLPGPWMGRSEWSAEGPSERRECRRCNGEGRVRTRKGIAPCEACGSAGAVVVDAYTGRVVAKVKPDSEKYGLSIAELRETLAAEKTDYDARRRRRERVDHLLSLGGEGDGEDWVDWVLRRKRALYHSGDFVLLERRLEQLAELAPRLAAAFMLVYGPQAEGRVPGPRLKASADEALDWLEEMLPESLRVPSWLLQPKSRDDEILKLSRPTPEHPRGLPQAAIAERLGVSTSTVSRRLKLLTAV